MRRPPPGPRVVVVDRGPTAEGRGALVAVGRRDLPPLEAEVVADVAPRSVGPSVGPSARVPAASAVTCAAPARTAAGAAGHVDHGHEPVVGPGVAELDHRAGPAVGPVPEHPGRRDHGPDPAEGQVGDLQVGDHEAEAPSSPWAAPRASAPAASARRAITPPCTARNELWR